MKKVTCSLIAFLILVACLSGCVSGAEKAQDTYEQLNSAYQFKQIDMCDANQGWAVTAENEVLYTDNGIDSFAPVKRLQETDSGADGFVNAAFVDGEAAYVAYFSQDNTHLVVEYTNDAGKNWNQTLVQYRDFSDTCDAGSVYISFADRENGYLLCCSTPAAGLMTKLLFRTTDSGKNYSFVGDLTNEITGYPQGILCNSGNDGYIAVTYHGEDNYLYKTADGGETWTSENIISQNESINYIDGNTPRFYGENKQNGVLLLKAVKETPEYQLFSTADGGNHWTKEGKLPLESVAAYSLVGLEQMYLIDDEGNLYRKQI